MEQEAAELDQLEERLREVDVELIREVERAREARRHDPAPQAPDLLVHCQEGRPGVEGRQQEEEEEKDAAPEDSVALVLVLVQLSSFLSDGVLVLLEMYVGS